MAGAAAARSVARARASAPRSACRGWSGGSASRRMISRGALGAPQVLITRARRDARAPAVASRFWLRLEAMTGGIARAPRSAPLGGRDRRPGDFAPADRPAPAPPVAERPPQARRHRGRSAQGRPVSPSTRSEMLKLSRARSGRCRSEPGVARQAPSTRSCEALGQGGWLRSRQARGARAKRCSTDRRASDAARAVGAAAARGDRLDRRRDARGAGGGPQADRRSRCAASVELDGIALHGTVDRIDRLRRRQPGDRRLQDRPAARRRKRCAAGYACSSGCSG